MIYFDNSSTTYFKPKCVLKAVNKALKKYCANPGRGSHNLSLIAGDKVLDTRIKLSDYFNLNNPENVIFTSGCTESLNLALIGTVKDGGHIVTTYLEHNSVLRCISHLSEKHHITFTCVMPNKNGIIQIEDIKKAITPKTYLIAINHTSNVIGATQNIYEIGKIAKEKNLIYLVDSAQSAGHEIIDMVKDNINLLAETGHKGFYGPQGVGFLLIRDVEVKPIRFGGTGTNSSSIIQPMGLPESLEAGTGATHNIIGLYTGISYVEKHFDKINNKIEKLTKIIIDDFLKQPKIKVYSHNYKSGVIGFEIIGMDSSEVVNVLNNVYHIYVRGGLQCAPYVHKFFGTLKQGLVRASLSYFNSMKQVKKFIFVIHQILDKYVSVAQ